MPLPLPGLLVVYFRFFENVSHVILIKIMPLDWNGCLCVRVEVDIVIASASDEDVSMLRQNFDCLLSWAHIVDRKSVV